MKTAFVNHSQSPLAAQLIDAIGSFQNVVVAFSGGVDSSVVAAAAVRAKLGSVVAVTARSPSVSLWQLEMACRVAAEIGIQHQVIDTAEIERPEYARNDGKRCFYCKQTLYSTLQAVCDSKSDATILSGTNVDDLGDYRPGIEAGKLASVRTPLADLGISKDAVRSLAAEFGLSNARQPASPCLSSRLAYGVEVTEQRLQRIERAEAWLRQRKFADFRVRLHESERARVEVLKSEIHRLTTEPLATEMDTFFRELGFRSVEVDLAGLRSGNLNEALVQIDKS